MAAGILTAGEVAERLMAALLKSAESKDFVGSNPTLSATDVDPIAVPLRPDTGLVDRPGQDHRPVLIALSGLQTRLLVLQEVQRSWVGSPVGSVRARLPRSSP
jgi:hypothetical protein